MLDFLHLAVEKASHYVTKAPEHIGNIPAAAKRIPLFNQEENESAIDRFQRIAQHSKDHHESIGFLGSLFVASPHEVEAAKTEAISKITDKELARAKKDKKYKDLKTDEEVKEHLAANKAIGNIRWGVADKLVNFWFNAQGGVQSMGSLITLLLGMNLLTGQHVSRKESFAGVIEGLVQLGATAALNQGGAAANVIGQQALYAVILPMIHKFIAGDPQQQPAYAYAMNSPSSYGYGGIREVGMA